MDLEQSGDMNFKISSFSTPLHKAAHYGHNECVQSLLGAGADVYATNVR